jgi:flavin-dependent dehydrogenase
VRPLVAAGAPGAGVHATGMPSPYDVIVAGGGPAGSSVASFLRMRGRSVLVLERERFPRFHVGESLLPYSNPIWQELGVLGAMEERFQRKPGARFVHEGSGAQFTYWFDSAMREGPTHAFHVKRADFDQLLLERTRELGTEVHEQTEVTDVRVDADGVTVELRGPDGPRTERGQLFIDATGRDTFMAGRQRTKAPDPLITTNVSLNCMYSGVARESGLEDGHVIIGLFDGGWYWVIPFRDGDTSVGFVLEKSFTRVRRGQSVAEMYAQVLDGLPHLKHLMRDARPCIEPFSEGNWSYTVERTYGDRVLLVGDSAAFVDPLFSTGILLATNAARRAAAYADDALRDGSFDAERFAPYQVECVAETQIFKRLITEFYAENLRALLIASAVNPTLCSVIVSVLAGDVARPALWHSIVTKSGFSHNPPPGGGVGPGYASSREVLAASKLARAR